MVVAMSSWSFSCTKDYKVLNIQLATIAVIIFSIYLFDSVSLKQELFDIQDSIF